MEQQKDINFHKFALQTNLFKGRVDLYFCYLKSEKLALAIVRIFAGREGNGSAVLDELRGTAQRLPGDIARLAADAVASAPVMAAHFYLCSLLRFSVLEGLLSEENGLILIEAYELLARTLSQSAAVSLLSLQDLAVPDLLPLRPEPTFAKGQEQHIHKGQNIEQKDKALLPRTEAILKVISENKGVSIKDIAKTVRDCSEKTIQRDLSILIQRGRVRKEGEKRWSVYLSAQ